MLYLFSDFVFSLPYASKILSPSKNTAGAHLFSYTFVLYCKGVIRIFVLVQLPANIIHEIISDDDRQRSHQSYVCWLRNHPARTIPLSKQEGQVQHRDNAGRHAWDMHPACNDVGLLCQCGKYLWYHCGRRNPSTYNWTNQALVDPVVKLQSNFLTCTWNYHSYYRIFQASAHPKDIS